MAAGRARSAGRMVGLSACRSAETTPGARITASAGAVASVSTSAWFEAKPSSSANTALGVVGLRRLHGAGAVGVVGLGRPGRGGDDEGRGPLLGARLLQVRPRGLVGPDRPHDVDLEHRFPGVLGIALDERAGV